MTLSDFLRLMRRSATTLILLALLGTLVAGVASLSTTKLYKASTRLYVTVQGADESSAGEAVQGSSAAQAKVRSYIKVVPSASDLQPVIDDLHLSASPAALAALLSVSSPTGTALLDVSVTGTDPVTAAKTANAITSSFRAVVEDLEKLPDGQPGLVKVTSLQDAQAPGSPSSPIVPLNLTLGLLAGLLAGVAATLLRNSLDTRIHGNHDVASVTDSPLLGSIGYAPDAATSPLIVQHDPRSPRAESFRTLRTNLQFLDPGARSRSYVITSALPSEGKSTTAANLAIAIAESGASVALVDADLRRPRTAEIMGIEGAVGLSDLLIGRVELEDVLQPWGQGEMSVLAAGRIPPNPSELLGSRSMHALLEELTARFDYVLMDAPPLLPVTDAAVLSKLTNGAMVVAAARSSRRGQMREALDLLDKIGAKTLGIILTKVPTTGSSRYGYGQYAAYYGRVPEPEEAPVARRTARRSRLQEWAR
ncbi:tyrosine-protein kinase domain-containing protein [Frondihabitans cladoniiphilus]|uniref:Polysaccharide biosynthesis tyrosine autokinase n=1 Tax=Frondihabitans cladoniiphilus TaxID=715785 RepID=A0ABP8W291_9MICO